MVEWVEQPSDEFMFCREPFNDLLEACAFQNILNSALAKMTQEKEKMTEMVNEDLRWDIEHDRIGEETEENVS